MKEKLKKAWMKVGKFLFWALMVALCGCATYLVFIHRHQIRALLKGEPLPKSKDGKCCPFRKKK